MIICVAVPLDAQRGEDARARLFRWMPSTLSTLPIVDISHGVPSSCGNSISDKRTLRLSDTSSIGRPLDLADLPLLPSHAFGLKSLFRQSPSQPPLPRPRTRQRKVSTYPHTHSPLLFEKNGHGRHIVPGVFPAACGRNFSVARPLSLLAAVSGQSHGIPRPRKLSPPPLQGLSIPRATPGSTWVSARGLALL